MTDSSNHTLITGFPSSFLAVCTLRNVLANEKRTRVVCVVHEKFQKRAAEILEALDPKDRARVDVLEGDTVSMDLGLSGSEFRALSESVNVIHHCAAVTYQGVDRRIAEQVNVNGTREVLELAEAAKNLTRFVHWSSALVSGARRGFVLEDELEPTAGFRNAIEETRFRAERIVRAAAARIPVTILRPAILVGDSKTGEIDRFEGPYLLIQLLLNSPTDLRIPLPDRGNVPLHLVPIDYAVDAGCTIARDPRAIGKTYHLVDPNPLTAKRVFELIATEAGRPLPRGSVPTMLTAALLRTPGLERFTSLPRAFLEQLGTEVAYDARNTNELLAGTSIACPPFESYVRQMVTTVRRRQAEQKARDIEDVYDAYDDPLQV